MRYRCATPARKDEKKIVKDPIRVNPLQSIRFNPAALSVRRHIGSGSLRSEVLRRSTMFIVLRFL